MLAVTLGTSPSKFNFGSTLRSLCAWISSRLPSRLGRPAETLFIGSLATAFRVAELLALTFVLQIDMLPLMARDFHRIPLSGLVVNLFAVPLPTVILPLGFLAMGAGLVFSFAGKLLAIPLSWFLWLLTHLVHWFAAIRAGSYRISGPPGWLIFTFFAAAIFLAVALQLQSLANKWPGRLALPFLAITTILIATFPFAPKRDAGQLELTILDVGQGDSLFVVSPKGRTMLIDGGGAFQGFPGHEEHLGPDSGEDVVSPYLWSRGFRQLDVVALTHAHRDHLGGLAAVLQNFRVGRLWLGREVASPALANL